ADAGQVVNHLDARALQIGAVADARMHQDLRRVDRAGGKDALARGRDLVHLAAPGELDAGRRLAFHADAVDLGAGQDRDVGLVEDRIEVVRRNIAPAPILDARVGDRAAARAFVHLAVVIGEARDTDR